MNKKALTISFLVALTLLLSGCATTYIKATATQNPPPDVKFSEYSEFVLKPFVLDEKYQGQDANTRATEKIEVELKLRLEATLASWTASSATRGTSRGTLEITPFVQDIKFISGGARFWAGAMAGSSAVVMKVEFRDAKTGTVVANPEFYQHANAWAGAMTIGALDNAMLIRIAELIADYTKNNFDAAVGGPTGAEVVKE